jgi:iron complex transport system substrate-binding protein
VTVKSLLYRAVILKGLLLTLVLAIPGEGTGADRVPLRIVSLAPSLTRETYDLRAQDLLVGITSYCEGFARAKEIIGSPNRINIEKTLSLKPDLVLASKDCNSKSDVEMLRKLGCRVKVFETCETFDCMGSSFLELGALLGRRKEAGEMLGQIRERIGSLESSLRGKKPLKIFWQMGTDPLVTAGNATFTGEFIRRSGCTNIFGNATMPYPRVNVEEVIRQDPDVILIITHMESDASPSMWNRFKTMSAVRNKRVYTIPADLMCQPTPAMFLRGFRTLASVLYPEVP